MPLQASWKLALPSFFAENNAGLGQIVGRKLHFYLIAWHDANEVLAHFARNMRENIARAG